jgi:hypothetical protein
LIAASVRLVTRVQSCRVLSDQDPHPVLTFHSSRSVAGQS